MVLSRRIGWLLVGFAVWSWIIWPTFLRNIWADHRSWHHGATAFFLVHLVLTVVSLLFGTAIGVLGVQALRADTGPTDPANDDGRVELPRSHAGPAAQTVERA